MTCLILTADASSAGGLKEAGRADIVIAIEPRFVWGPPRSQVELAEFVAARTTQGPGSHWLDYGSTPSIKEIGGRDLGLLELCQRCEKIELWMETEPNAQLVLIWLLDYLHSRADAAITKNLVLCHVDASLGGATPKELARWKFPFAAITKDHFDVATLAWQAYREPTPRAWFGLLNKDLSILPQLRRCVVEMLEELPGRATGLSASEMRILELISAGYWHPFDVFPHYRQRFQRRVFGYWEVGTLLERLALAPVPAISGLAEWPFTLEMHNLRDRYERYKASKLSLTPLGKAILSKRMISAGTTPSIAGGEAPN